MIKRFVQVVINNQILCWIKYLAVYKVLKSGLSIAFRYIKNILIYSVPCTLIDYYFNNGIIRKFITYYPVCILDYLYITDNCTFLRHLIIYNKFIKLSAVYGIQSSLVYRHISDESLDYKPGD